MSTPLMWKAYSMYNKLYTKPLYPHILTIDVPTERFRICKCHLQLIPFYISLSLIFLNAFACLYLPTRELLLGSSGVPLFKVMAQIYFSCIMILNLGLIVIMYFNGFEIYEIYCSGQFWFHRKLLRNNCDIAALARNSKNGESANKYLCINKRKNFVFNVLF